MATRQPKVSIGLPVFNGEKFLPSALNSLLRQDYEDFELIVSDNASTDTTEAICQDFAAKDRRIRYSRNETNIGATGNYNRVFQLARGDFFKWASHDDECHPSLVRRCLETFEQAPVSTVLVFSKAEIIDELGCVKYLSPDGISSSAPQPVKRFARVLWSSAYAHPLWGLIRSDALRQTRLMGCLEADHILLAELALLGQSIEIPEPLYRMRRHARCATEISRSARELLAWHDPKRANDRIYLPHWERVYLEFFKGVRHIPLSRTERLLCYGAVPVVSYWRRLLRWTGPVRKQLGLQRKKTVPAYDSPRQPESNQCRPV
jgi:glycosyltransferase involved in cell wall biosynthesis